MDAESLQVHELFLTLFTANEPAIRAYVRSLVPTRHDAADVMQAVSLVLWKKFRESGDMAALSEVEEGSSVGRRVARQL